jgi:hypothetical protein
MKDLKSDLKDKVILITGASGFIGFSLIMALEEIEKRDYIGSIELLKSISDWRPIIQIERGIYFLVNHYSKEYFNEIS